MQTLDPFGHTMLLPAGTVQTALRLVALPTVTGPAHCFAVGPEPVATVEMLAADGGWAVAQHDLSRQLA